MRPMRQTINRILHCLTLLVAMASAAVYGQESTPDPLEPYNRVMFQFNETADRYFMKPVARGYRAVTPDPVERGLSRMFDNVGEVVNVANDLLQGKFDQAANDAGRLLINSTLGLAGFFDVAADMGLDKSDGEDFGQTLGRWGLGSGPYLVLPFLGASTLRDGPARFVDGQIDPISDIDHIPTRNSIYGVDLVVTRAELLKAEELVTGDRYTFIRDVYLQRREYLVNDGEFEDPFGGDYGDPDDYY